MVHRRGIARALSLVLPAALAAQVAPPPRDSAVLALVRRVVTDSLAEGGRRDDQRLAAATPAAAALLGAAGLAAPLHRAAARPTCPGSTTASDAPVAEPVGYVVDVTLAPPVGAAATPPRWILTATKSCAFRFRGQAGRRGFVEGAAWELRQIEGQWRIAGPSKRWVS